MKLSELWLREWVNPTLDSNALVEQMTMFGLEVKSIEVVTREFTNVVIGRIVTCCHHPHDDKLWITKVDIKGPALLNIVCSAPNCRNDLRVAVDIVSTVLHDKHSQGKLCSYSELGITGIHQHIGIIELPIDAPIGCNLCDYLQLNDQIIDISVTPNRADCLGILGIAREVALINKLPLQQVLSKPVKPVITNRLPIYIDDTVACPRYLGRVVQNINASIITPLWIKEKLRRSSISLVNVVVDITNYILLEFGQPMHAFDMNSIHGGIIVRLAEQGEKLILLNGREVTLTSDTLIISDYSKILAIAGILGGMHSSISLTSRDIFLECAFFTPLAIIGRARRYSLHTEASLRYERGVDPELPHRVIERATELLLEICGGQPGPIINVTNFATLPKSTTVNLRRTKLFSLIGHIIPDKEIHDILVRIGCTINDTAYGWQILTPSWRFDLEIEENLIKEVVRIYGYHNIPNVPIRSDLLITDFMTYDKETVLPLERVKTLLVDRGYHEIITYSFINPKIQELLFPGQNMLLLPKPISPEMSAMRLSLLPGILSTILYNKNRQQENIRFFESGLCFIPDKTADQGIRQDLLLAGAITGLRFDEHWDLVPQPVDFYDVKGDIEAILQLTGKLVNFEFQAQTNTILHPGQSAAIYLHGEIIGWVGVIHPTLEEKLNLNLRTLVFEILWEKITERKVAKATSLSPFPTTCRDINIVVAENIRAIDIINQCKLIINNNLYSIKLLSVYKGIGISKDFKSLAIRFVLQNNRSTLKEKEIAAIISKCIAVLKQRFQASLRD
ncbi:phenylalanine--tRNA ligase subunit beta [Candidatus Palibaumannia cicadellinicola]|uniref:Phenylalanine--tRNA ligase beta subunit n=1 Tax=Candidatus Palibaumannia cicadellinicola TaxID=186490 RepID=A0A088MYF8_9GAMM|nr:phenylalanine--tRNA ligase subunit beta [Candidatus Baumannia cicadellinicola]AIN47385.1 Phenylalanyl-tRNA synthetase beta chain [Candidatus Baumannia cicadellinicola]